MSDTVLLLGDKFCQCSLTKVDPEMYILDVILTVVLRIMLVNEMV